MTPSIKVIFSVLRANLSSAPYTFNCHIVSVTSLWRKDFQTEGSNMVMFRGLTAFTHRRSHAVGFGVYETSDLSQVAVALGDKLDGGGLHEEGIVWGQDALDALLHVLDHYRLPPAVHELPHLVIGGDFCFLQDTRELNGNEKDKGSGIWIRWAVLNSPTVITQHYTRYLLKVMKYFYQTYLRNMMKKHL